MVNLTAMTVQVAPTLVATVVPSSTKQVRVRGQLASVSAAQNDFVVNVQPFTVQSATAGQVTAHVSTTTTYQINGTAYVGATGLTALAALPADTMVAAFGSLQTGTTPTFTATNILAGTSLQSPSEDLISGTVIARAANALTVRGATWTKPNGSFGFERMDATVNVGANTAVTEEGQMGAFTIANISVGQHISCVRNGEPGGERRGDPRCDCRAGAVGSHALVGHDYYRGYRKLDSQSAIPRWTGAECLYIRPGRIRRRSNDENPGSRFRRGSSGIRGWRGIRRPGMWVLQLPRGKAGAPEGSSGAGGQRGSEARACPHQRADSAAADQRLDEERLSLAAAQVVAAFPTIKTMDVAKEPLETRAHCILALALVRSGGSLAGVEGLSSAREADRAANLEWAVSTLRQVEAARHDDPVAQANLGEALAARGSYEEEAVRILGGLANRDLMETDGYAALARLRASRGEALASDDATKRGELMTKSPEAVCHPRPASASIDALASPFAVSIPVRTSCDWRPSSSLSSRFCRPSRAASPPREDSRPSRRPFAATPSVARPSWRNTSARAATRSTASTPRPRTSNARAVTTTSTPAPSRPRKSRRRGGSRRSASSGTCLPSSLPRRVFAPSGSGLSPSSPGFATRPSATMPRLNLDDTQARDIAAFLSPSDDEPASAASAALAGANPARGRELMDVKGCGLCHQMTGVAAIHPGTLPTGVTVSDMARAIRLAPDLRFTRDRWQPSSLVRWLQDPPKMKADTLMPSMGLAPGEARSIAAYVLLTSLAPVNPPATPVRLAALDRKVTYDEVATRGLRKTCWHCHGEPDFERGDGGPGNSGGFGFKGRGLNLSDYPATFAGYLDDTGQRTSVFTPTADGTPFIVAAMLAREKEEGGEEGAIRGMPLGLPALPPEDVQLVYTWIAQGRPR